jgi:hypothetical protein
VQRPELKVIIAELARGSHLKCSAEVKVKVRLASAWVDRDRTELFAAKASDGHVQTLGGTGSAHVESVGEA